MRDQAVGWLRGGTGSIQPQVLRDWPELIPDLLDAPLWRESLEREFLYGAWRDGLAAPMLLSSEPGEVAVYRLLTGQEFEAEWVEPHYRRVGVAARTRILARMRALGLAHLLTGRHDWERETPLQALQSCPPGWARELLERLEESDPWLDRLRAAAPGRPLRLDYPRPQRAFRHRWRQQVRWCAFAGERLVVWERPGQLWLWEPGRDPRKLGGEHPVRRDCHALVPHALIALHRDGMLRRWELPGGTLSWEQRALRGFDHRLRATLDGRQVLVGAIGRGFEVVEAENGSVTRTQSCTFQFGFIQPDGIYVRDPHGLTLYGLNPHRTGPLRFELAMRKATPESPFVDRGRGRLELPRAGRPVALGGHPDGVALSASGELLAVRRRGIFVNVYRLSGEGRDRPLRYDDPRTPDEHFATLLWEYQHRHQIELDDHRPPSENDIELL